MLHARQGRLGPNQPHEGLALQIEDRLLAERLGQIRVRAAGQDLGKLGAVDFGDVLEILAAWGNPGGPEDLDGSGTVDFGDILVVLAAWGPC